MGEIADVHQIQESLAQLRCPFTWELKFEDTDKPDLENRILEQIEFLDVKHNVGVHNLLAYVKDLNGQHEQALQSLKDAEDLIQREPADWRDTLSLVTWGNYAWVHYHMGSLTEAQAYLDKVEDTCKKLESPFRYRVECPEMDCEEGWALLKCGGQNYKQAMACFAKALEVKPECPQCWTGYAITAYRQDYDDDNVISLEPLRQAVRLSPDDSYIKALLALKLQDVHQESEGTKYLEEALSSTSCQAYVFRYAAKFYRRKGCLDEALHCLEKASQATPSSGYLHYQRGLCYRAKLIQVKKATNKNPRKQYEIEKWAQRARCEFQKALTLKPTLDMAYVCLAEMHAELGQYKEAEETFQKIFNLKNLADHIQQEIHYRYGCFQQYQLKSEDKAITHFLKGLKVEERSFAGKKLLNALEKLATRRVHQEENVESISLLGFVHKLKGEVKEALLCYEKALRLTGKLNPMF
uniref:Uncharacterized protein n=1 Tax=Jaculus jaculus TaxID=51337 RepID=A0A8C5LKZ4_JACJA|nr:interferon-induced protein with tetratricopeptide repeats 1B isoform X2 [Jaculus jaculus]